MSNLNPIKKLRYELFLSQREFSELMGIMQATISRYEANKQNPTVPILKRFVNLAKEHNLEFDFHYYIDNAREK